jgi:arsenate reductase-like glutaredoxin family protein
MKPLFGGSPAHSSRIFLLRSTRSLTVYSLLSEPSKRDEINEVMSSLELCEILANESKEAKEEDEILEMSGSESDSDVTAMQTPQQLTQER